MVAVGMSSMARSKDGTSWKIATASVLLEL